MARDMPRQQRGDEGAVKTSMQSSACATGGWARGSYSDRMSLPGRRDVIRTAAPLVLAIATLVLGATALVFAIGQQLPPNQQGVYVYDLAHIWQPDTVARAQQVAEAVRARTQA